MSYAIKKLFRIHISYVAQDNEIDLDTTLANASKSQNWIVGYAPNSFLI